MTASIRRDNHYVSEFYLNHWAAAHRRVWTYSILVEHPNIPLWRQRGIRGVAYAEHLYTRVLGGGESDEIEVWLAEEFESPAAEAIHKVTTGARLTRGDWKRLVRFVAAQDLRTPARLVENLSRWPQQLPEVLDATLRSAVRRLERAHRSGRPIQSTPYPNHEYIPFRGSVEPVPEDGVSQLRAEVLMGRGLWLFSLRHCLRPRMVNELLEHHWTILSPPDDLSWFTSDDPVVRLNYSGLGRYNFDGAWASPGTEIFMPLSPHHLLYTQVGNKRPAHGPVLSRPMAEMLRRFMAEHAPRTIFAAERDADVPVLHPRTVDAYAVRHEREQWRRWHQDQTAAERELIA